MGSQSHRKQLFYTNLLARFTQCVLKKRKLFLSFSDSVTNLYPKRRPTGVSRNYFTKKMLTTSKDRAKMCQITEYFAHKNSMATIFISPTPLKRPHSVQSTVVIVWFKQSSKKLKVQKRLENGIKRSYK